ncbi:MAG: hypothetical protein BV459_02955 [Thermoplasmata archaeon M11B2D]|nr:MAG: hypothetical protein BV459_02955 [Thermoplasmata archaeon M11B2D]PNX52650.1 MAG: hypothetical protein BV458_08505 [Thermoplasmata archaeon M9B2D]
MAVIHCEELEMKKKLTIIGIIAILACVGLSGCNEISNLFLSDEEKLVGTWNSMDIWTDVPKLITFSLNNTFMVKFKIGPVDYSLTDGIWEMNSGILTVEIVDYLTPPKSYTYKFSEENTVLTLTDRDSSKSYILQKQ